MTKERIKFLLQAAQSGMIHGNYVPNLVDIQQLCALSLWALEAKEGLERITKLGCQIMYEECPACEAHDALKKLDEILEGA